LARVIGRPALDHRDQHSSGTAHQSNRLHDVRIEGKHLDPNVGPVVVYHYMKGEMWNRRVPSAAELRALAELWLRFHHLQADGLWVAIGQAAAWSAVENPTTLAAAGVRSLGRSQILATSRCLAHMPRSAEPLARGARTAATRSVPRASLERHLGMTPYNRSTSAPRGSPLEELVAASAAWQPDWRYVLGYVWLNRL
jgi:hypothetical protein